MPLVNILDELHSIGDLERHIIAEIEDSIGSAIKYIGAEKVLEELPLNLPTIDSDLIKRGQSVDKSILSSRAWLLPLLKDNSRNSSLLFFGSELLPKADLLFMQANEAKENNQPILEKTFRLLAHQIWKCFPAFCNFPNDISSFRNIAKKIGTYFNQNEFVRPEIVRGLINLIERNQEIIK